MKNYYNTDEHPWMLVVGLLTAYAVPVLGVWWFGTRFTTLYHERRLLGGLHCFIAIMLHIGLLLYIILKACNHEALY